MIGPAETIGMRMDIYAINRSIVYCLFVLSTETEYKIARNIVKLRMDER